MRERLQSGGREEEQHVFTAPSKFTAGIGRGRCRKLGSSLTGANPLRNLPPLPPPLLCEVTPGGIIRVRISGSPHPFPSPREQSGVESN